MKIFIKLINSVIYTENEENRMTNKNTTKL